MAAVDTDDQPALRSFVAGLRRDQDAVTAGLTLRWNSGIVEGHVNRIKNSQKADVRPREARPAPQTHPAHQMTSSAGPSRKAWQNQFSRIDDSSPVLSYVLASGDSAAHRWRTLSASPTHASSYSQTKAASTWPLQTVRSAGSRRGRQCQPCYPNGRRFWRNFANVQSCAPGHVLGYGVARAYAGHAVATALTGMTGRPHPSPTNTDNGPARRVAVDTVGVTPLRGQYHAATSPCVR